MKKSVQEHTILENMLIKTYKQDLMNFIDANPEYFPELINLAFSDNQPYSWRASWLLWSSMQYNDARLRNYVDLIIEILPLRPKNQQRELLIILQKMELKPHLVGILFDICSEIWIEIKNIPSLRYNAFKTIIKISSEYPEFLQEVSFLIDDCYTMTLSESLKKIIMKFTKKRTLTKPYCKL